MNWNKALAIGITAGQTNLTVLALSLITGLNRRSKLILSSEVPDRESFMNLSSQDVAHRFNSKMKDFDPQALWNRAEEIKEYCDNQNIGVTLWGDSDYPELLENIYDPPLTLFTRGRALERDFAGVALVGTRKASGDGLNQAFQCALDLTLRECPVVSGLALGIDASAHRGALAGRGWTIGVLASGVDRITPRQHETLAQEILISGGTLLSEYLPGTEPLKYRYPERNRIISALSTATIVVEAPERSGALITADFALQEGRDLYVCSAGLHCDGSNRLVEEGAPVLDRGRDLLDLLDLPTVEGPGKAMAIPRTLEEWISQMEGELRGDALSYGGDRYSGV